MLHLIYMPFGSITHPPLALSLFKAQLAEVGIPCRVHHFNLHFAQRIGFGSYESVALFKGVQTQISEWLFAEQAWGKSVGLPTEEFLDLCSEEISGIHKVSDPKAWLRLVRQQVVPAFVDECVARLRATGDVDVVAFSCTFFQTIASLALGRRLKQEFPNVKLAYGGACFHDRMGWELIEKIPWIDAVSVGETDDAIVPFFQALLDGKPPEGLQGILYRHGSEEVRESAPYQPVSEQTLDALPPPNFDDFFTDAAAVGLTDIPQWQKILFLPFESSRGCWWGQKRHCTFCGLNAEGITYRAKSSENVLGILEHFSKRYPIARSYHATDNILQTRYFQSLIPTLKNKPFGEDINIFYEVRITLSREQIQGLADAGITRVQPGIESLSNHLLKLMNKGTTALQNICFMKWCRESGILMNWNNLIRIPGETYQDYQEMEAWIPHLVHLMPPAGGSPKVECHRFSPYFYEAGRWIEHLKPAAWYQGLFPKKHIDIAQVAYYFEAQWKDTLEDEAYDGVVEAVLRWIQVWRTSSELPRLNYHKLPTEELWVEDTRWDKETTWIFNPAEASVYRAIEKPTTFKQICKNLRGTPGESLDPKDIERILQRFLDTGIALSDERFYLGLAIKPNTVDPPLEFRRPQFSSKELVHQLSVKRQRELALNRS
ncbi:MAG: RiPP maturation radical SAM C-methyltransferase [Cyanobacteria bacterium SID2]|nr:RiPP maturation radical SAM C-methyltransferase [Cyanobacteria bacterium SID2]MBP0005822.1 RiPP maturation radical SAM C-methyltransferase [Cyanobacteria bacterium SBC]